MDLRCGNDAIIMAENESHSDAAAASKRGLDALDERAADAPDESPSIQQHAGQPDAAKPAPTEEHRGGPLPYMKR